MRFLLELMELEDEVEVGSVMRPGMEAVFSSEWVSVSWDCRLCWMARSRCDHFPVGVSGQRISIAMAEMIMRMNGTIKDTLQAT